MNSIKTGKKNESVIKTWQEEEDKNPELQQRLIETPAVKRCEILIVRISAIDLFIMVSISYLRHRVTQVIPIFQEIINVFIFQALGLKLTFCCQLCYLLLHLFNKQQAVLGNSSTSVDKLGFKMSQRCSELGLKVKNDFSAFEYNIYQLEKTNLLGKLPKAPTMLDKVMKLIFKNMENNACYNFTQGMVPKYMQYHSAASCRESQSH